MSVETYYGRPCAKGHDGLRLLSNRKCVLCNRADRRDQYAKAAAYDNEGRTPRAGAMPERLSLLAIYYEQEFDREGWHRASPATVEY